MPTWITLADYPSAESMRALNLDLVTEIRCRPVVASQPEEQWSLVADFIGGGQATIGYATYPAVDPLLDLFETMVAFVAPDSVDKQIMLSDEQ
jgi:hypothetical protein